MLNQIARLLNDSGNSAKNRGWDACARGLYLLATKVRPKWSDPWYNLGLQAKYQGDWRTSLKFNERASQLDPDDQASWWNLGIAATAIQDWTLARKAWNECGITFEEDDEIAWTPPGTACVRLNPEDSGEVVWGGRIDPARIQIWNVPLPNSKRRYRDIVLNDGAQEGTRTSGDFEYPVFNELDLWHASAYSTFQVGLTMSDSEAQSRIVELCDENNIGVEDWGTVRIICAECSRGNPGRDGCHADEVAEGARKYGFAAIDRQMLLHLLRTWAAEAEDRSFSEPHLVLLAD